MPSVPLSFVVALLLLVLLATLVRRRGTVPPSRPFLALVALCAVQSALIGLRWGYGIHAIGLIIPVLAAAVPGLVYTSFASLTARAVPALPHVGIPAAVAGLLVAVWRGPLDGVLIALSLGYAVALFALARSGPDALGQARLHGAPSAHRALQCAAAALAVSAMIDGVVALDFEWGQGAYAAPVIAAGNLLGLAMVGLAATVAGGARPPADSAGSPPDVPPAVDPEEDREVMARLDGLMREQRLYRSENLSLDRLARRAGIPARRISAAVNRTLGRNVSQYVNDHRVAEACRLLAETGQPVTTVMLDAGFQTKSNFNREFRRVTDTTPLAWRERTTKPSSIAMKHDR